MPPHQDAQRRLQVLVPHLVPRGPHPATPGLAIVVGGSVLDIQAKPGEVDVQRGTSVPGTVQQVPGGVGRNVAEGLSRLLAQPRLPPPMLLSLLGDDAAGSFLLTKLQDLRLDLSLLVRKAGIATPCVAAAFDKSGELAACVADVASLEQHLTPAMVSELLSQAPARPIRQASLLVVEANLSAGAIEAACGAAAAAGVPIFMEPVSVPKSARCLPVLHLLTYIKPNAAELVAMADALCSSRGLPLLPRPCVDGAGVAGSRGHREQHPADARPAPPMLTQLVPFASLLLSCGLRYVVLTLGPHGAALLSLERPRLEPPQRSGDAAVHVGPPGQTGSLPRSAGRVLASHMEALPALVLNLSGAGDSLVAGMVAALLHSKPPAEALAHGLAAAKLAVQSNCNVPPAMTFTDLEKDAATAAATLQHYVFTAGL